MTRTRLHRAVRRPQGQSPWIDNLKRVYLHDREAGASWSTHGHPGRDLEPDHLREGHRRRRPTTTSSSRDAGRRAHASRRPTGSSSSTTSPTRCAVLRPVYDAAAAATASCRSRWRPAWPTTPTGTIEAARRLHERIDRPNLIVKIPATAEGVPAIRPDDRRGPQHQRHPDLQPRALRRGDRGLPERARGPGRRPAATPSAVRSVASFFVSRVDTEVDRRLEPSSGPKPAEAACGARRPWPRPSWPTSCSEQRFSGPRWEALGRPGRPSPTAAVGVDVDQEPGLSRPALRRHPDRAPTRSTPCPTTPWTPSSTTARWPAPSTPTSTRPRRRPGPAGRGRRRHGRRGPACSRTKGWPLLQVLRRADPGARPTRPTPCGGAESPPPDGRRRPELAATPARSPRRRACGRAGNVSANRSGLAGRARRAWRPRRPSSNAWAGHRASRPWSCCSAWAARRSGRRCSRPCSRQRLARRPGTARLVVCDTTHPATVAALDLLRRLRPRVVEVGHHPRAQRAARPRLVDRLPDPSRYAAITDPGTPLAALAAERGFARCFENPPDIGGRYSVLSYFGMVPAALIGYDVAAPVRAGPRRRPRRGGRASAWPWARRPGRAGQGHHRRAARALRRRSGCGSSSSSPSRPASTAPGACRSPPPSPRTGADRHVVPLHFDEPVDLGEQFYRWEVATAVCGHVLGIDPFDEPNVAESKHNTNARSSPRCRCPRSTGRRPGQPCWPGWPEQVGPGDYVSIQAYLPFGQDDRRSRTLRLRRWSATTSDGAAVTAGYGPRFLHSTGPAPQGRPRHGRRRPDRAPAARAADVPIPGKPVRLRHPDRRPGHRRPSAASRPRPAGPAGRRRRPVDETLLRAPGQPARPTSTEGQRRCRSAWWDSGRWAPT